MNENLIKIFKEPYPYFNEVVEQVKELVMETGNWNANDDGQIAIQTKDPELKNWFDGCGASPKKTPEWEREFNLLQYAIRGTAIADYIDWLETPVYRTRIMLAREKSSYSIHRDYSPRLHLPLITNTQCNFLFTEPPELIHMPADGTTYWVDTRKHHTFLNGSGDRRLHLVMIVEN
jgi:hypothetical protein